MDRKNAKRIHRFQSLNSLATQVFHWSTDREIRSSETSAILKAQAFTQYLLYSKPENSSYVKKVRPCFLQSHRVNTFLKTNRGFKPLIFYLAT